MKNIYRLLACALLLFCVSVNQIEAQNTLQALPDNVYLNNSTNPLISTSKRFNVQANDIPGDCSATLHNIELEIIVPPTKGVATEVMGQGLMQIDYRVPGGVFGQDKLTYKITCSGVSSTAEVFINIGNIPDFIDEAECIVTPPPFVWDIERKYMSSEDHYIHSYANPIVGDLDGDGSLDILVLNHVRGQPTWSNKIYIFDYLLNFVREIPIPMSSSYVTLPLAIANIDEEDGDGEAKIIIATGAGFGTGDDLNTPDLQHRVMCYGMDGTLLWTSSEPYWVNPPAPNAGPWPAAGEEQYSPTINIQDIDGDGKVEIYVGDKIFAGESGKCLVELPPKMLPPYQDKDAGRGKRWYGSNALIRGFLPAVGDIDGDGKMEIVGGNTTYTINITNRNGTSGNTATVLAQVPYTEGYTSLADIDGDGILDVVVVAYPVSDPNFPSAPSTATNMNPVYDARSTFMYAWQGSSNDLIGNPIIPRAGKNVDTGVQDTYPRFGSRAFIGDIEGNGRPAICFTSNKKMDAWAFDGTNLVQLWTEKYTTDGSGATTMSMFDFNNDGEMELVYRDETHIRILDKNGNNVKDSDGNDAIFACYSGTHTEYPIVVDLDGDGHAEILVAGSTVQANQNSTQRLMVFGSKTPNTWSPTRQVWNQHSYVPLTINEDLTVPAHPLSPTTPIIHQNGSVHRPFNGFLMQAGILNSEGDPLLKAYDLAFQPGKTNMLYHDKVNDRLTIQCFLTNVGSIPFTDRDIKIALYSYDPTTTHYTLVGANVFASETLIVNENKDYTLTINNYAAINATLPTNKVWYLAINLDDQSPNVPSGFYLDQVECNSWNNLSNSLSYVYGSIVLCEGTSGTLNLKPQGVYGCQWFDKDRVPYPTPTSNTGDAMTVTKNGTDNEFYLIDVYESGQLMSFIPDTAWVYAAPDSLIWTGRINKDWHNVENWYNPADPSDENPMAKIPRLCTNILIPKLGKTGNPITNFPDLGTTQTDYNDYIEAQCNNITFEHGAEVMRSDLLTYSKAFVQLTLMSNRWYCFAPPLRDFNAGDIYLSDPNPLDDEMYAFTRLFSQKEPEQGRYIEGTWSNTFNTPNYKFYAGQGLGVWIDDWHPNASVHDEQKFEFPKTDTQYYVYDDVSGLPVKGPYYTNKTNAHRLIYEEAINNTTKDVPVNVSGATVGEYIMIGNPFMAHVDFNKFYLANQTLIEDHFRIMDAGGSYSTYSISGVSTGNPVLTQNIPPMQSVLVKPKTTIDPAVAAKTLRFNVDMTISKPGSTLRSKNEVDAQIDEKKLSDFMWISIAGSELYNRAALVYNPDANINTNFVDNKDIFKLMRQGLKATNVYFLTEEGYYMDIKQLSDLDDVSVRIGFAAEEKGNMAIAFERLWDFARDYQLILEDRYLNRFVDLRQNSVYSFTKENDDLFTDDRFVLRFNNRSSGIKEIEKDNSKLDYRSENGIIEIFSTDNSSLGDVSIFDLQGRLIQERKMVLNSRISFYLNPGVYLVKVPNIKQENTLKVFIK